MCLQWLDRRELQGIQYSLSDIYVLDPSFSDPSCRRHLIDAEVYCVSSLAKSLNHLAAKQPTWWRMMNSYPLVFCFHRSSSGWMLMCFYYFHWPPNWLVMVVGHFDSTVMSFRRFCALNQHLHYHCSNLIWLSFHSHFPSMMSALYLVQLNYCYRLKWSMSWTSWHYSSVNIPVASNLEYYWDCYSMAMLMELMVIQQLFDWLVHVMPLNSVWMIYESVLLEQHDHLCRLIIVVRLHWK